MIFGNMKEHISLFCIDFIFSGYLCTSRVAELFSSSDSVRSFYIVPHNSCSSSDFHPECIRSLISAHCCQFFFFLTVAPKMLWWSGWGALITLICIPLIFNHADYFYMLIDHLYAFWKLFVQGFAWFCFVSFFKTWAVHECI